MPGPFTIPDWLKKAVDILPAPWEPLIPGVPSVIDIARSLTGGGSGPQGAGEAPGLPGSQPVVRTLFGAPEEITSAIMAAVRAAGIRDEDAWIPFVIAFGESGYNPKARGDSGESVGLFQLHSQGAGAGMSVEEREDPLINATRIMPAIAKAIEVGKKGGLSGFDLLAHTWFEALRPRGYGEDPSSPNFQKTLGLMRNAYYAVRPDEANAETIAAVGSWGGGTSPFLPAPAASAAGVGADQYLQAGADYTPYQLLLQSTGLLSPWISAYINLVRGDRADRAQGAQALLSAMANAANTELQYRQMQGRTMPGAEFMAGFEPGGMLANFYRASGNTLPEFRAPRVDVEAPAWLSRLQQTPVEPLLQTLVPPPLDPSAAMAAGAAAAAPYAYSVPPWLQDLLAAAPGMAGLGPRQGLVPSDPSLLAQYLMTQGFLPPS